MSDAVLYAGMVVIMNCWAAAAAAELLSTLALKHEIVYKLHGDIS